MTRMFLLLASSFVAGCCCQRQLSVKSRFDPYNQAKPVEWVEVQWSLTY